MAFLPVIAMVATAAGAAVKAFGDIRQGQADANRYMYQAAVAKQNEQYALQVGERQANISGMKTQAQLGAIRAAQGASNLDVNRGSAKQVQDSQLALGFMDEGTIRARAARAAWGEDVQGTLDISAAKQAKTSSYISATSSILGGAGSVADKWMQYGSNWGNAGGASSGVSVYNQGGSAGAIY